MWFCGAGARVAHDATHRPNRMARRLAVRPFPLDVSRRRSSFTTRPAELALTLTLLLTPACSGDRGFRFHAEYGAPRSGYRLKLISEGWVESGHDLSEDAFALIQFCPVAAPGARPFRVTLSSRPAAFDRIASADLGLVPTEMKRGTGVGILTGLLSRAGYRSLDSGEVVRTVRVMRSALLGSQGVVLEGQIDSLDVLGTRIDYGYEVAKDRPPESWIRASDLPGCAP